MTIISCVIWVPAVRKPFPNDIQARIPLVICLFVFTVNPYCGTAVANGVAGIIGTFWACFHMWVMNGIFPGGMKEGMSSTSACAIFGWVNFLAFTFIFLFVKCGMGMKMFAMATDIGFMLAFLDPASTVPFSENFTISHKGTAVNTLLATAIACFIAPLLNLIPYPFSLASVNMKGNAVSASKGTAKLFAAVIAYYNESEYSVVIESELKHSVDLKKEIDGLGGAIGAAWFERFDIGVQGTIRALMESHQGLMSSLYDRLRALMIAVSTEDFGESHVKIMGVIGGSTFDVANSVKVLLIAATEAATDGDISASDKAHRAYKVISKETFGESFFVLTVSAYARMVVEYAEVLCTNPPKGVGMFEGISAGVSSTFSGLGDKFNVNFTIKHFVAILVCWLWSVYIDNWGGGCVITAVFLMSTAICPDIQVFLNVINAVIVAVVVGTLVFQGMCGTGYGDYLLPLVAVLIWLVMAYGYFSGGPLLLPCLLIVALTPFRWVTMCPTGDIAAGARGLWAGLVSNCIAIFIVCTCQFLMAVDKASNLALTEIDEAFKGEREAFNAFFAHKDITEAMGPVGGHIGTGSGYNGSAKIEPRLWKAPWKGSLYDEVMGCLTQLRLDLLMLWFCASGSDGKPDGIFSKFEHCPGWVACKSDLVTTFEDAHNLVMALLKHDGGKFKGLSMLKQTTGIDTLDDMPDLIAALNKEVPFPTKVGDTIEDDEVCQIASALLLLDIV